LRRSCATIANKDVSRPVSAAAIGATGDAVERAEIVNL
jgi:hypothetical protein